MNDEAKKSVSVYDANSEYTDYKFYFNGQELQVSIAEDEQEDDG